MPMRIQTPLVVLAALASLVTSARGGTISFSGRDWTTQAAGSTTPAVYTVNGANSGSMRGSFGDWDAVMLTPISIAVGDKISYDYTLTDQQVDLVGDGNSNWFTDSSTYFAKTLNTFDTPWASRRLIVVSNDRWNQQL